MKKTVIFIALWALLGTSRLGYADEGFYVGAQGGVNFLGCHYLTQRHCILDTGYNAGFAAGYGWCCGPRLEGEITYRDSDYRLHGTGNDGNPQTFHGNVDTWSFMANGYYDVPLCLFGYVEPYVGAGIGGDRVHQVIKIEGENFKGSHSGFAWQLMGGFSVCWWDALVSLEYKFHKAPLRYGHHLQNHSITIGIKKFLCCSF